MKSDCKRFRHEPYYTPNNYDLTFNPSEIPANIPVETADELEKRLQKLMPLGKIIHVSLNSLNQLNVNDYSMGSSLKINNIKVRFK